MAVSVTTTLICLLCATWSALLFTIPAIYFAWKVYGGVGGGGEGRGGGSASGGTIVVIPA